MTVPAYVQHQQKTKVRSARSSRGSSKKRNDPSSTAAVQIVREAVKDGVSVAELSQLAAGDPAFALRVLSLVNSAAHARNNPVSDVQQAIALLGIRGLRNVALSLMVSDLVPMGKEGELLLGQSLRRALACRLLAQTLKERDTDSYFTAGLLLESGLLARARDDLDAVAQLATMPAQFRVPVEIASGHQSHPQRGADLAAEYKLPAETVEAIRLHHAKKAPEPKLARVCWLAERVASVFESAAVSEAAAEAISAAAEVGIDQASLEEILESLPGLVAAAAEGFQRPVGDQLNLEQLREDAHARLVQMNYQLEQTVRTLEQLMTEKQALTEQLQEANRELSKQAATDVLTGLPNRRALEEALDRDMARARREEKSLSFVIADVDRFKKFNDTYGHQLGDEVLKVVGKVLRDTARKGDVPARFGGEEFCVILPSTDEKGAAVAAERIRSAIEATQVASAHGPLTVTASFGIATIAPRAHESKEALFRRADAALYQAKEGGRNQVAAAAKAASSAAA